ncbi:MAG: amylo-alpha-1,6-glucosidase [Ktedonobacteraceae bacterium]
MSIQHEVETEHSTDNAWELTVGPDVCRNVQAGLDREWIVTNGLGGYASGTVSGATTRSYHGLLVAALIPPVERDVLVTKIDETIELPDTRVLKLGVNEYRDGTIDPQGYTYLDRFTLEADVPCFRYQLNENLTLEKRVWMEYGQNTTYVQYALSAAPGTNVGPLTLTITPYCVYRSHHASTHGDANWHFLVEDQGNRCRIRAYEEAPACVLVLGPSAHFTPTENWFWGMKHRRDTERGLPDIEDVYQPGTFQIQVQPGESVTMVLSAEAALPPEFGGAQHGVAVEQAWARHQQRIQHLLKTSNSAQDGLPQHDPVLARLVIAADQFIVARPVRTQGNQSESDLKTIIAGYPWFADWGRDSMISLPGLLMSTGRYREARDLLKAFASYTHGGLIPNRFPDSGEAPEYNTIDGTLWMFHAIDRYVTATGDWSLLDELFLTLSGIIDRHVEGTIYNIGVDPDDGLLRGGTTGVQLTWMDAKVGDWVVTPRHGKPIEVNALWYFALTCMESWAEHYNLDASRFSQLRAKVRDNFARRFWYEEGGYLYDVVDVEGVTGQNDASLRPNQVIAASLTPSLFSEGQMRSMLEKVTESLLTPLGLRSLSPDDPSYCTHYNGNSQQRDGAYHRGTVWQWLIGPYVDVHLSMYNDRAAIHAVLQPLVQHLWDACLGTISEIAEPEPPFTPVGCYAQAWSVAEVLRCWRFVSEQT